MANKNMEGQRKSDPFEAEPWLIAEVFNRIDTISDQAILDWVNNQCHSTYRDDNGNPQKYGKSMTWVKSIKTRKRQIDKQQGDVNEDINWRDYKKIYTLNISRANLSRCRAVLGALKGKILMSVPVQSVQESFIDEEGNTVPERQGEGLMMAGKRFDLKEDYRWLIWADHILTYVGEDITDDLDIWIIAKMFAKRDREHQYSIAEITSNDKPKYKYFVDKEDLSGKDEAWNQILGGVPSISKDKTPEPEMDMQDLDDWLDYRPWVSKEKEDIYKEAIANGLATKLNFKPIEFNLPRTGTVQMHSSSQERIYGFYTLASFLWSLVPDTNWQLPSQQLVDFCEEGHKTNLHLIFNFGSIQFGWKFDPPKKGKSDIQT